MAFFTLFDSPLGSIRLESDGFSLTGLYFPNHKLKNPIGINQIENRNLKLFSKVEIQLNGYFAGERTNFDVPVKLEGTEFQKNVWLTLLKIFYGKTISYKELAIKIGRPNSFRAVGQANSRNPISVIIPCHRVVGIDGSLTGYGGGLETKAVLLNFENYVLSNGPHKLVNTPAYALWLQRQSSNNE